MGVPLPHLVLPLSGCLSRHTPTRAKRGEARGHRSVLAQNSLLMYPLSFFFLLDLSSTWCVLVGWWIDTHVFALLLGFSRWLDLVDMWVAEGHTTRWPWLSVLLVHRGLWYSMTTPPPIDPW